MILVCASLSVLALLQNACAFDEPSFRSSWNDGGKPILRLGGPQNYDDTDTENIVHNKWVQDLRTYISELVNQFGYDAAKPFIEKVVDDTEKKRNVLLHVQGNSKVDYKQYLRSPNPEAVWPPTKPPPPQWLMDFKAFIKNLIERYGRANLDDHLRPVIKYVERLQHVYINDIDGEVIIDYVERPHPYVK